MKSPVTSGDIIMDPEEVQRWEAQRKAREEKEKAEKVKAEKEKAEKKKAEKEKAEKKKKKQEKAKKKAEKKAEAAKTASAQGKTVQQQPSATIEVPANATQTAGAGDASPIGITSIALLLGICIAFVFKLRSENKR